MKAVSYTDTIAQDVVHAEGTTIIRPFYGKVQELCDGPQTFLANKDPSSTISPHFHDVDQFQVIVDGSGRIGRDPADPIAFHYADAYTPYGPIVSGDKGLSFYTIRAGCAGGHFGMPESRHLLPGLPGRILVGRFEVNRPVPAWGVTTREQLIEVTADGVEVIGLRMGPHAQTEGHPVSAGAQYYIVCTGVLRERDQDLPRLSMILVEPGDTAPTITAGVDGAEVLILQFPRGSDRPGSQIRTPAERGLNVYHRRVKH